ncbi:MAG: LCP family protein [Lachnospira sp.]|nr:LCP family protein [Lachnospira sp.]
MTDEERARKIRQIQLKRRKKRRRKIIMTVILSIILVLVILFGVFYMLFEHYYSKMNFLNVADVENDDGDSDYPDYVASTSGVYNVLLIGVDSRENQVKGNSDVMILLSVNHNTKKIHMMSFMRDLYADIDGYGVRKLNAANNLGGPGLLMSTIEKNYGVNIDSYAAVDFLDMASIIDTLGGVDIDLQDEEVKVLNMYLDELCSLQGVDPQDYYISSGGQTHLNGLQAVAYSRIRYVGNADFQRTQRQRDVLAQLMGKLTGASLTQLSQYADEILPHVTHDLSQTDLLSQLAGITQYKNYQIVQERIPYDNHYTSENEILIPDWDYTLPKIQEDLNS